MNFQKLTFSALALAALLASSHAANVGGNGDGSDDESKHSHSQKIEITTPSASTAFAPQTQVIDPFFAGLLQIITQNAQLLHHDPHAVALPHQIETELNNFINTYHSNPTTNQVSQILSTYTIYQWAIDALGLPEGLRNPLHHIPFRLGLLISPAQNSASASNPSK